MEGAELAKSALALILPYMPTLRRQFFYIALLTLAGALLSIISGTAQPPWRPPPVAPGEIRLSDAQALDVIWVDARTRTAFETAHIPEAIFFDPAQSGVAMADILQEWLGRPRPIVVYCSDANCGTSKQVADKLRLNLPDAEIYSLKGGWETWAE